MEEVVEIVKQTSDGFVFDTKQFVNTIDKTGHKNVAIVSIIGKQRTGKSLLLNYLMRYLKNKEPNKYNHIYDARENESALNGFDVNVGKRGQTNGIWIWCKPFIVEANDGSDIAVLLMETRCNFDEKAYNQECSAFFALSFLLSSTVIVNVKNDLNEEILKAVEHVANFAQSLNKESKADLFQRLEFLIRDWDNECEFRFGYHDESTNDVNNYKKNMINPNTNVFAEIQNMKKRLLSLFGHIGCYLMPHPGKNVAKPNFNGQIDFIDKDFQEKCEEFVKLIIDNLEPKTIGGIKLNGKSFKDYINKLQHILRNVKFGHKSLCWVSNDETDVDKAFKRAYDLYKTRLLSYIDSDPTDEKLIYVHNMTEKESLNYLSAELTGRVCDGTVKRKLDCFSEKIAKKFKHYRKENSDRIEKETSNAYIPCYARRVSEIDNVSQKSKNMVAIELPCPGSYNGSCDREDQFWVCKHCEGLLEYGFDGYFYCVCGRASVYNFEFKCNSKYHPSSSYLQFTTSKLKSLLGNKEINILILGETGVGKSTWINGFANYLTHTSLAEAKRNELLCVIASSFTMTDNNYQRRVITCGEDTNEVFTTGESATQEPKAYVFDCENKLIRLIDTPGIGDTRGIEQDKKNFNVILKYISNFENMNGICILLKPNNARLGVMFRFCIKELLIHLHRDASRNIVFCFTNARSTFYRPGDTMPALESLLRENKDVEIKLSKDTIYCMDNESFRFLCALQHGIAFDEEDCNNYAKSWDKSVSETNRMVEYISGLKPHAICNTLSINECRNIITSLAKPLADITQNIITNINVVEQKKRDILSSKESEKGLNDKLHIDVIQLEANQLGYPRTVCTNKKCVKFHNIEGSKEYTTEFITHCHTQCYLKGVTPDSYPNPELKRCSAMAGTEFCSQCECSWDKHMHITYEQKQIKIKVIDESVEDLIKDKQTMRKGIELHVKKMEKYVKELNEEKNKITVISAKFAKFLRSNSIVPYNDALGDYLDVLIRMEKDKVSVGGDRKILEGMEQMKYAYNEEVLLLNQTMTVAGRCEQLMPTDIMELVNELYSLKHKGKELKQIMEVMLASKSQISKYHETNYRSPNKGITRSPYNFISKGINLLRKRVQWQKNSY